MRQCTFSTLAALSWLISKGCHGGGPGLPNAWLSSSGLTAASARGQEMCEEESGKGGWVVGALGGVQRVEEARKKHTGLEASKTTSSFLLVSEGRPDNFTAGSQLPFRPWHPSLSAKLCCVPQPDQSVLSLFWAPAILPSAVERSTSAYFSAWFGSSNLKQDWLWASSHFIQRRAEIVFQKLMPITQLEEMLTLAEVLILPLPRGKLHGEVRCNLSQRAFTIFKCIHK